MKEDEHLERSRHAGGVERVVCETEKRSDLLLRGEEKEEENAQVDRWFSSAFDSGTNISPALTASFSGSTKPTGMHAAGKSSKLQIPAYPPHRKSPGRQAVTAVVGLSSASTGRPVDV